MQSDFRKSQERSEEAVFVTPETAEGDPSFGIYPSHGPIKTGQSGSRKRASTKSLVPFAVLLLAEVQSLSVKSAATPEKHRTVDEGFAALERLAYDLRTRESPSRSEEKARSGIGGHKKVPLVPQSCRRR